MKKTRWCISVVGLNLERFLRVCAENDIDFFNIKRGGNTISAEVEENDLAQLCEIVNRGGWEIKCREQKGVGKYLAILKRRAVLLITVFVMAIGVYLCSQMVWSIEIISAGIYETDVRNYLASENIQPMCWKRQVDLLQLSDELIWRYPDVAWVECGWRGTELRIDFIQGTPDKNKKQKAMSGDIIASKGGIVESVVVTAGTPQVQAGDIIQAGDLLISGQERGKNEEPIQVRAQGVVKARVWDSCAVRLSLVQLETEYTGNMYTHMYISCPWFDLNRKNAVCFDQADRNRTKTTLGGLFFPFDVISETLYETSYNSFRLTESEAKSTAGNAALKQLDEKTGFDHDLVDKWVDYCMIEDEILEAVAYGERIIDVAVCRDSKY